MIKIQHKIADTYQKEQHTQVSQAEAELTRDYGNHSLAFLGLAPENLHLLISDGEGLVNYRETSNAAVVLGDPVCAPKAFERVTRSFLNFCAFQKRRVVFYQAYSEHLATYRALKLHAFKMGEEAIIHPQTFTLSGSALANVRTSSRRAEREGVRIQWHEGVPPLEVMEQLEYISKAWLEGKTGKQVAEMGFSMGKLVELIDTAERAEAVATHSKPSNGLHRVVPRLVTGVVTTSSGKACACVTFTPIYGCVAVEANVTGNQQEGQGWGWALDLMRRSPDAPPGVMELLLVRAIERFRSCGAQVVSLGMVAMADTRQEMTPGKRQLISFITDRLGLLETRATLFNFKRKFHPCWESRYLVTNTTFALPKIALSVLRLRNYSGGRLARLITRLIKL
jgi:phosphatidylglycerol lysyltransferase